MARPLRIEFAGALYHVTAQDPAPPLQAIAAKHRDRDASIAAAYATGAYSYREIAAHFGLHLATVGRIIRARMLQGET